MAQRSRTVHSLVPLGTITGSNTAFIGQTQIKRGSVLWAAKAILPKYVAENPGSTCTILRGRFPSEPLSFQLLASGPRWAAIGTAASPKMSRNEHCTDHLESDSVSSRTLERSVDAGSVTVESCVSACQSQMFTIAGLEYAQECCRSANLRHS